MGGFSANAKAFAARYMMGDKGINIILEAKPIKLGTGSTSTIYASIRDARHTGAAKPCEPRLRLTSLSQRCYNPSWGSFRSAGGSGIRAADTPGPLGGLSSGGASGDGIYNFHLFQTPSSGFGGFEILNVDGGADAWEEDYNWQNADCKLLIGEIGAAYSAFEDLWHFKAKGDPKWRVHGSLAFEAKLGIVDFEQPIQRTTLGETNRLAPLVFGRVTHAAPELSTESSLTYTLDATRGIKDASGLGPPDQYMWTVHEGRNPVTAHATLNFSAGTFALDATPVYGITTNAQSYYNSFAHTQYAAAEDMLDVFSVSHSVVTTSELDSYAGIYVSTDHNFRLGNAVSLVLGSRGIWWLDADGAAVTMDRVNPPEDEGSTVADFIEADVLSMERVMRLPPIRRHKLLVTKYWDPPSTVIVEDANEQQRFKSGGDVAAITVSALTDYPDALDVWTDEVLAAGGGSGNVDLTVLFNAPRSIYRIALTPLHSLDAWIGDYISVTTSKAPGFSSAKNLLVVGIEFDFQNRRVALEAFG